LVINFKFVAKCGKKRAIALIYSGLLNGKGSLKALTQPAENFRPLICSGFSLNKFGELSPCIAGSQHRNKMVTGFLEGTTNILLKNERLSKSKL
jgi:hypothetical protein